MKTFFKIIGVFWGMTYSTTGNLNELPKSQSQILMGSEAKITQTCDVFVSSLGHA